MQIKEQHSLPTAQELAMLNKLDTRKQPSGVDPGFKYRNAFLLIVSISMALSLLFFPYQAVSAFGFPPSMQNMPSYFQARGFYVLVVAIVYIYSYVKDWHFPRVSLIITTLTFAGLVFDFFNVYRFVIGPLSAPIIFFVMLRFGAVYCLFMNSIRDNRAPPMPRNLFS